MYRSIHMPRTEESLQIKPVYVNVYDPFAIGRTISYQEKLLTAYDVMGHVPRRPQGG